MFALLRTLKENRLRNKMELHTRSRRLHFPRRPLLMGILNVTGDSFSGDGRIDTGWALGRVRELVAAGADCIDVGGESARTNRDAVTPEEECRRILPVLEAFADTVTGLTPRDDAQVFPPLLSVNTWRPEVAEPALAAGADLLNDMSALPDDRNARLCAASGAALLIMHSVGAPKVPHTHIHYTDIVTTLREFFREKIALAEGAGMAREALVLDPGIDFAKQAADNLCIYRELESLHEFERPILLPISRKEVIGKVLGLENPIDREAGTVASLVAGMRRGAHIFRVHNVDMAWETLRTIAPLQRAPHRKPPR